MSVTVAVCFLAIVISTLAITAWAGRRSGEREAVYAAGGQISATQNGLAIAGDLVSSGAIFGSVALFYVSGAGMVIYFIAPLVGLCLLLVFVAGPLRRLGRFTVGDVLTARLGGRWTRVFAGICTIVLSEMYLVAQFVGAGTLFATLLDISFITSVTVVGLLTTLYVGFGGMLATTWIQIIKATPF